MARRLSVAICSVWPPERKKIPGTAAGTWRESASRVRCATVSGPAWEGALLPEYYWLYFKCLWIYLPDVTIVGLRTVPSR